MWMWLCCEDENKPNDWEKKSLQNKTPEPHEKIMKL